eukprot:10024299-Lingulodinium_polyedra.AAC.1
MELGPEEDNPQSRVPDMPDDLLDVINDAIGLNLDEDQVEASAAQEDNLGSHHVDALIDPDDAPSDAEENEAGNDGHPVNVQHGVLLEAAKPWWEAIIEEPQARPTYIFTKCEDNKCVGRLHKLNACSYKAVCRNRNHKQCVCWITVKRGGEQALEELRDDLM